MKHPIHRLIRDQDGATALEYGLLATLIAAVIATAVGAIGTSIRDLFNTLSTAMNAATS
ncbi:Flp family type IVb pilin [Pseudodesulfovibrio sp. zrk46]|uniref:Flp family type IVb pilin n=1 Tax=Pseudodesulfovibrio sp. zrk46 TaxID=2725288 RepID=UPI0014493047|nr:Flp family type IVb pilin [Pseudodesulfovibrio sp. zrk46]QJB55232.1 Flp family type IVb pilin [Pseudodesulfovibrio sp. zrk46]